MSSAGQKRTFGATIRTLNDITNSPISTANQSTNKTSSPEAQNVTSVPNNVPISPGKNTIQHIPTLPRANDAASILTRIHSEFAQIIQKRNYNVLSITEMCCCSDGLDHVSSSRRKTKLMPHNVMGYNLTHYTRPTTHRIHLRLRHVRTHELLDYESIAGTMCHELAHCVVGSHNAKFYKVMEEIEEQYALFMARGVILDKDGFPMGSSSDAYRLGGSKVSSDEARRKAVVAAEKRRGLSSGMYVLGGGGKKLSDPKEAARIAAERRLRDSQFCLPCNEVIELLGDSDDEDVNEVAASNGDKKKKTTKPGGFKSDSNSVIDLTDDQPNQLIALRPRVPSIALNPNRIEWTCACCTLINQPASLMCEACDAPSNSAPAVASAAAALQPTNSTCVISTSGGAAKDIKWSCTRCTFDNSSTALVCGACCMER
ncbi:hypothetical protein ACHAXN_009083 [Cyclotella atomus]